MLEASDANAPIGLIAGNGHFPRLFAQAAQQRGVPVVAVALRGETLPQLQAHVTRLQWVHVGQLRRMVRFFQAAGVRRAAMAGGINKARLFGRARLDLLSLWILARHWVRRDDGLLRAVAQVFESAGISIVASTLFMPEILAPSGVLTVREPSTAQWHDLNYGYKIAQSIGALDIGQSVVVKDGAVVALEAMEGTDACVQRAGMLTQRRTAVLVKTAKPPQDMRFDVPAVGLNTLRSMRAAGIDILGIEAGRTLLLEPQAMLAEANRHNMVMVGLQTGHPAAPYTW